MPGDSSSVQAREHGQPQSSSRQRWRRVAENVRWSFSYCWPEQRLLILGLLMNAVVSSLLPAASALALRGLVNEVTDFVTGSGSDMRILGMWLLVSFLAALAAAVTGSVRQFISVRLREDLHFRVNLDIFTHVAGMDYQQFEDPAFHNKLHRAQRAADQSLAEFIVTTVDIGTNLLQAISLVLLLVVIEPLVVILVPLLGIPYFVFRMRISRHYFLEEYTRATKRRWIAYYMGRMSQPDQAAESRLLDLGPLFVERLQDILSSFRDGNNIYQVRVFLGGLTFAIISTAGVYLALIRVINQIMAGALTVGDLAIFGSAAVRLRGLIDSLIGQSSYIRWQMMNIEVLRELFAVIPQPRPESQIRLENASGAFEIRDVDFTYPGTTKQVLRAISLSVEDGETVALVGENGAGKTTLAMLLAGLYHPVRGQILLDGYELQSIDRESLRQHMAFVFQSFGRYEASAAENIAFGDHPRLMANRPAVEDLAREVGLDELIQRMPQGYETMLGRMFGELNLSGGQWQLFAIARALARGAKIIVLDEPTANLDVQTEYEIFQRFKDLAKGRTTVLVSHRFSTVKIADRIIVLDGGRIVESGSHNELLAQGGKYAALYAIHRQHLAADEPDLLQVPTP